MRNSPLPDMCLNQANDLGELVDPSLLSSSHLFERVPYLPYTAYWKVMSFTYLPLLEYL